MTALFCWMSTDGATSHVDMAAACTFASVLFVMNCALSFFLLRSLFQFRQPACCNCVCVEKIVVTSKFFSYCEAKAFLQMLCFSCYLYTFTTFSLLCCLLQQSSMRMNFYGLQICVNVHFFLCTVDVVEHFFLPICYFCCSFFLASALWTYKCMGCSAQLFFFFFFCLAQHATFSRVLPTPEIQEA